jgi:hypothetical protein
MARRDLIARKREKDRKRERERERVGYLEISQQFV